MASSSAELNDQREMMVEVGGNMPKWVDSFLQKTFFGSCLSHESPKNELNMYCITCDVDACRHCVISGSHEGHKFLQIYRHVYKDVVSLEEMENLIDCGKIQPFKCNKKWVISLNPLPHCGSGAQETIESCNVCKRRLNDPYQYRFCSISCKVNALHKSREMEKSVEHILIASDVEKQKRKRKATPHRAPFY